MKCNLKHAISKTNFSIEQRELLISEVQSRPPLRNDQHPSYKKTDKTNEMWDEVVTVVGFPDKEIN